MLKTKQPETNKKLQRRPRHQRSQYKNKMAVPTGHHNNSVLTYDRVQTQQQEEMQENGSKKIIINSNLSLQSRTEMSKVTFRRSTTLTYYIKCVPYRVYKVQRKSDTQSSRYPTTYVHAIITINKGSSQKFAEAHKTNKISLGPDPLPPQMNNISQARLQCNNQF